tara:strand:- start:728 stop:955 length:228 start_codon:yes stop_codon:yes gene_type:complete
MEVIHYLIYPIAGLMAFLALGGLNTKNSIVISASIVSLCLNTYAIYAFVWWPIPASIAVDLIFKKVFGDPGAHQG